MLIDQKGGATANQDGKNEQGQQQAGSNGAIPEQPKGSDLPGHETKKGNDEQKPGGRAFQHDHAAPEQAEQNGDGEEQPGRCDAGFVGVEKRFHHYGPCKLNSHGWNTDESGSISVAK